MCEKLLLTLNVAFLQLASSTHGLSTDADFILQTN